METRYERALCDALCPRSRRFGRRRAYHRVRSRGEREIANGSRARSGVTPDRTEASGFLSFVQQPIRRLSDDRIRGHEILARPFGRADSAARGAWLADKGGIRSDFHAGTTWAPKGRTRVVGATGRRFGMNLESAVGPCADMRFMAVELIKRFFHEGHERYVIE
ncbi:hypothetical protein [Thiohalorhabdus sp.]|uniref:hypothetical protein n=1 Tax=Thiohalorhabdus sp. TaxID=3094134 RepID=UPI003FCEB0D0